jgi:hypothetical protein
MVGRGRGAGDPRRRLGPGGRASARKTHTRLQDREGDKENQGGQEKYEAAGAARDTRLLLLARARQTLRSHHPTPLLPAALKLKP